MSHEVSDSNTAKPAIGSLAPDFALTDPITAKEVRLSELRGREVLLVFFRGTWCPFCREQMTFLRDNFARLEAANIAVVGVVCQNRDTLKKYLTNNPLSFPVLPDESRAVAKLYGAHYWLTYEGINLANPSVFVLDPQGVITFAYIGKNMGDLPLSLVLDRFLTNIDQTDKEM